MHCIERASCYGYLSVQMGGGVCECTKPWTHCPHRASQRFGGPPSFYTAEGPSKECSTTQRPCKQLSAIGSALGDGVGWLGGEGILKGWQKFVVAEIAVITLRFNANGVHLAATYLRQILKPYNL